MISTKSELELFIQLQKDFTGKLKDYVKLLNIPYTTLVDAFKRLREKVIDRIVAIVNPSKLGFGIGIAIITDLSLESEKQIKKILATKSKVNILCVENGIAFFAYISNKENFDKLLEEIVKEVKGNIKFRYFFRSIQEFNPTIFENFIREKYKNLPDLRKTIRK